MIKKIHKFCKLGFPSTKEFVHVLPDQLLTRPPRKFDLWVSDLLWASLIEELQYFWNTTQKEKECWSVTWRAKPVCVWAKVIALSSWVISVLKGIAECVGSFFREESWLFRIFQSTWNASWTHMLPWKGSDTAPVEGNVKGPTNFKTSQTGI